jgi:glycosyltransferase involved in cell wall biosynthesis
MQPLVTIITPTFNHGKYIKECIESVLKQTICEWEQIIIDDGSSDNTISIVESFKDNRIKLVKQDHKGIENLKDTYNHALQLAQGEYIAILEGDDYWHPDKLERQLPLFDNKDVLLVWGSVLWVHEDGQHITSAPPDINRYLGLSRYQYLRELLFGNFIPAVTVMLRKDMLRSMGGFQQTPYMVTVDYPTWLQCVLNGETAVVTDVVGYWRRHSKQMSTARQHEMLDCTLEFACEFFNNLPVKIKENISEDVYDIRHHWHSSISESCFHEGRKCLLRGFWHQARKEFRNAIRKGCATIMLKSVIGMIASYGHFNIEGLASIMGKERIDDNDIWID